MFNADRLLSDLIGGGLSAGGLGGKRYRYRSGYGLGDAIGRTVMSPQGLTILGGLAIAAYEHFKGTSDAGLAGQPGGPVATGQGTPPASPGAWRPGVPPPPGTSDSSRSEATPPPFVPPVAPGSAPPGSPAGAGAEAPGGDRAGSAEGPADPADEARARLLIIAMVNAAKADGTIDPDERARILGRLAEHGSGEAERAHLEEEMARPLDIDRLVSQVRDPVLAAQVYAASLLAIDPDTPAEKAYLAMLAARLNLDPGVVRELESRLDAAGA
jgi:hypothetical protein